MQKVLSVMGGGKESGVLRNLCPEVALQKECGGGSIVEAWGIYQDLMAK